MRKLIDETVFNPYVRNVLKVNRPHFYPERYYAYDHRLFYVSKGSIGIEFEDQFVTMKMGTLILIPPKVLYRLVFFDAQVFEYYVFNFDFDSEYSFTAPRTPEVPGKFDEGKMFSKTVISPFQQVFLLQEAEQLSGDISELLYEYMSVSDDAVMMTSALMKRLLVKIIRLEKRKTLNKQNSILIQSVKDYMKEHMTEQISNADVAKIFGYHPYYLNDLFVRAEGVTLHKYLTDIRMTEAKKLLIATDKNVAQIAEECGFSGTSYFCEYFKKKYKITPSKFRKTGR